MPCAPPWFLLTEAGGFCGAAAGRRVYSPRMEKLHPALLSSLDRLPQDCGVVLLTRHSLREQPDGRFAGYDVPLTPAGVDLARQWGGALGRSLHAVMSSPVGRCTDTARAMLEGAGISLPVQTHSLLVEPGSFVSDMRRVGPLFLRLGPVGFASRHLSGEPLEGLLAPREGTARILSLARGQAGPPGSFSLLVTHDTILAAVVHTLRETSSISDEDWPWMMEGLFLWFQGEDVHWLWRGEPGRCAFPGEDRA